MTRSSSAGTINMRRASGGNFANIESGLGQGQDTLLSSRNAQDITVKKSMKDVTWKRNVLSSAMGTVDGDGTGFLIAIHIAGNATAAKSSVRGKRRNNSSSIDTGSVEAVHELI